MYDRKKKQEKYRMIILSEDEYDVDIYKCDDKSLDDKGPVFAVLFYKKRWYAEYIPEGKSDESCGHKIRFFWEYDFL